MKHFISILILAALFYSTPIFGQPTFAIRGGANLTTFGGDGAVVYPSVARKSIRIGASAVIPIRGRFSLQFGGDYVPKGLILIFDDLNLNIDYIEFSGLGTITLISSRRAPSLSLLAGPTMAFKVRVEGEDQLVNRYWENRLKFKTLDFGVTVGIGAKMAISKTMTFKADLLYTEGIRSLSREGNDAITNRAIAFCVGLGFPYGRRN